MIKTTVNMSIKNLKKMYEKTNNLSLDAEMQRGSGQWVGKGFETKRSLLINSLLNAYPIPPLYFQKLQQTQMRFYLAVWTENNG